MHAPERMELMGLEVPLADEGSLEAMARCIVEEFARMGFTEEAVVELFRNPFYRGPHVVYRQYGEDRVRQLIRRILGKEEVGAHA